MGCSKNGSRRGARKRGHEKGGHAAPRFLFFAERYLRLAAYATNENGAGWLVIHILNSVGRLAEDDGLNAK